jgi:hypothetical protein
MTYETSTLVLLQWCPDRSNAISDNYTITPESHHVPLFGKKIGSKTNISGVFGV